MAILEVVNKSAIFEFNESQLVIIEDSKQDILDKKTQSNEQVNKEIDEWLND